MDWQKTPCSSAYFQMTEIPLAPRFDFVWQESVRPSGMIAGLTNRFPAEERFGLTAQILRSAASVHANIAEGHGRGTRKDYLHFLAVANGSLQETDSLMAGAIACGLGSHNRARDPRLTSSSRSAKCCASCAPD
jgi:four helix bundle protein